jgi:hypothetical protein
MFFALSAPLCFVLGSFVGQVWSTATNWVNHLDRQAWLFVLCTVLVIGAYFLRGFGSRSNY